MPANTFTFRSHIFFDELDALWVLHHSRYLHHLERAQQAFFQHLLGVGDFNADRDKDIYVVVKNITVNYLKPIRNPGEILVRYTVARIREAGLELDFEILSGDTQQVHCRGQRTVCKLSDTTHTPTGWTPKFREALVAWANA